MKVDQDNFDEVDDGVEYENTEFEVDCTEKFTTDNVFATRSDLLQWARNVGKENGIVVVTIRSETATGRPGTKTKLVIGCERSGKYRPGKNLELARSTGTKKCDCPFRLKGRPTSGSEGWILIVSCGLHNHELAETLVGHSFVGRLSCEEKTLLEGMTKNMVKPRNILLTMKNNNAENMTTMKQIYNARQAYRSSIRGNRTEMQQLLKLMDRDRYVYRYRLVEGSNELRDIFWTHPDAITLVNTFHLVLIIDSTYKTCRYRLPLLEIVGVTSTGLTFSVAFAYLQNERTDNFAWALSMLKEQITSGDVEVIVTDRDLGLMNALRLVFPCAYNLLCLFHVCKNVRAKCKTLVAPKKKQEEVMEAWDALVRCSDAAEYMKQLGVFERICHDSPYFYDYVMQQWLKSHKEKFVEAWTNQVMHLGNTTTNRVESAHWSLKRLLQDSMGDLCSVWDAVSSKIILQHTEIKASFQKSIVVQEHRHSSRLYAHLRGVVSRSALMHIADEFDRVKYVGIDKSLCGCIIKKTHGFPCACELAIYSMMPATIPLDTVHIFWRSLNFVDEGFSKSSVLSLKPELEVLEQTFDRLDVSGKIALKGRVLELVFPATTSMYPPPAKVKTKGAPKKGKGKLSALRKAEKKEKSTRRDLSYWERVDDYFGCSGVKACGTQSSIHKVIQPTVASSHKPPSVESVPSVEQPRVFPYMEWLPVEIHPFISNVVDVGDDGNCGYRSVGALLGRGEESWPEIRHELTMELQQWAGDYSRLFGGDSWVYQLIDSLYVRDVVRYDNWMTLPEMGHVIASTYNVVLVSLSLGQSLTFLPLRRGPSTSCIPVIAIAFVKKCHFVQVHLQRDAPIPPPTSLWRQCAYEDARTWEALCVPRIQHWLRIFPLTETPHINLADD